MAAAYDGGIAVWDLATGEMAGPTLPVGGEVAFDRSGERLLVFTDKVARVWSVRDGKPMGRELLHDSAIRNAFFDAAGDRAIVVTDNAVRIWDARAGEWFAGRSERDLVQHVRAALGPHAPRPLMLPDADAPRLGFLQAVANGFAMLWNTVTTPFH